jgi:hypothetical protein
MESHQGVMAENLNFEIKKMALKLVKNNFIQFEHLMKIINALLSIQTPCVPFKLGTSVTIVYTFHEVEGMQTWNFNKIRAISPPIVHFHNQLFNKANVMQFIYGGLMIYSVRRLMT